MQRQCERRVGDNETVYASVPESRSHVLRELGVATLAINGKQMK